MSPEDVRRLREFDLRLAKLALSQPKTVASHYRSISLYLRDAFPEIVSTSP